MSASFSGSLLAWITTGIVASLTTDVRFTEDPVIKALVITAIFLVGAYYFYSFGAVEVLPELRTPLRQAPWTEWLVRTCSLALLFCLWFILEHVGWKWFASLLVLQHLLYLLWDWLVRHAFSTNDARRFWIRFVFIDLMMTLISLALFVVSSNSIVHSSARTQFALGVVTTLYLVTVGVGAVLLRFDPRPHFFERR